MGCVDSVQKWQEIKPKKFSLDCGHDREAWMNRTSVTHPLRIDTVTAGPGYGRIGITFCPGKYDPHGHTGSWDRDLALDLYTIQKWGASAVVTLLENQE